LFGSRRIGDKMGCGNVSEGVVEEEELMVVG
jgi:hypothetical protein